MLFQGWGKCYSTFRKQLKPIIEGIYGYSEHIGKFPKNEFKDTEIVKIMRYRSMDLSKIKDKNEKAYYKKMQELYKIPISKDEQEKLEEIERALLNGEDVSKLL